MTRIAVIDSSPLINLTHLGLTTKLALFFEVIYVPRSVQREVNRKSRFRYRLRKLYRMDLFRRCAAGDTARVNLLLTFDVGEGEAEALVQAQEQGVGIFIGDEQRAREIAQHSGLKAVGTVRLLARLHLEGQAEETWALVRRLRRELRFRVTDDVVREAIAKAPETI